MYKSCIAKIADYLPLDLFIHFFNIQGAHHSLFHSLAHLAIWGNFELKKK